MSNRAPNEITTEPSALSNSLAELAAYDAGRDAYHAVLPLTRDPHRRSRLAVEARLSRQWRDGWQRAARAGLAALSQCQDCGARPELTAIACPWCGSGSLRRREATS